MSLRIKFFAAVLGFLFSLALALPALGAGMGGEAAPEFPPGVFTDGQQYRLADLRGKVVVLFMYEASRPSCRAKTSAEFNPIVDKFKGRPVKFIGVGAGDTALEVREFVGQTGLRMPVYVDAYSLMERRYGQTLSLQNIYQWRVIGPDGTIAGNWPDERWMTRALEGASWKYKDESRPPALAAAVEHFEWGRYEAGMKLLRPFRKNSKKEIADGANALYGAVRAEGQQWKATASASVESEPAAAYDAYARVKAVFEGDADLLAGVDAALAKLKADKAVTGELAARKMMATLAAATAKPKPPARAEMAAGFRTIAKKYPETPTGRAAMELAGEMGG